MPVILKRAQIRRGRKTQRGDLDITVKSAEGIGKYLAPTWPMVLGHKDGTLSDEDYEWMYRRILDRNPIKVYRALWKYGKDCGGQITFLCYCPDGVFCHTHLLIDYLLEKFPTGWEDGRGK